MGRAGTYTYRGLELNVTAVPDQMEIEVSALTYDEIERKILEAIVLLGYDPFFTAGPGSSIKMDGVVITCEAKSR